MTATQSLKIYELLNAQFQQPDKARALTEAIEAVIDMKVAEGNKTYEALLHKDLEILRKDLDVKLTNLELKLSGDTNSLRSELLKTIYIVGLVQFLAIVGSVLAIVLFVMKH